MVTGHLNISMMVCQKIYALTLASASYNLREPRGTVLKGFTCASAERPGIDDSVPGPKLLLIIAPWAVTASAS